MSSIEGINQHLEELRKRIMRIIIVIGVIFAFIISFHLYPIDIAGVQLYYPALDPINNIAAQITNYMKNNLVPEGVQLIQTQPGQALFAQIYVGALVAIVVGMPVIIKESVGFIKPALKEREIKVTRSIALPALALFITGCVFSYFLVIPYMLEFLYMYGDASGLITFLNIMDFITFVLQYLLAFGVSFQIPLIMYALSMSGIVGDNFWRKNIRYAILAIIVFGAIVTPDGSGITMWFIAVPMMALYLGGMIIIGHKKRKKDLNLKS
ncbi:MAG: twin-arginine translocase subunit TatC [Nitrosarchaeum sp.]|nr:twin-arginine translocase subunit TatC [Nitrosarchaeum sp.]MBI2643569.1 twin-arginine translocase subunit TatC [Nitrosarchaeum sp.]MBI4131069.1 twin-arginine translocase subunit TatC [Nitrosarchaeum sp.]